MVNKKVLIVIPSYGTEIYSMPTTPLVGPGYIAQALEDNYIEYDVLDMRLGYSTRKLIKKIRNYEPDILSVSMMTYMYIKTYQMLKIVKKYFPHISIIVGGPHVSSYRSQVLKQCKEIDYGCVMDGEKVMVELAQGKNIKKINGLIYRSDDCIITNKLKLEKDIDKFNWPMYSMFELDKYYSKEMPINTSKGCPYSCIFCAAEMTMGKKFRYRSPKNIVDEIMYWVWAGYDIFNFVDDNFTLLPKRVYELCDELEDRGLTNLNLKLGRGVRADKIDKNLLKRMKGVGFNYIAIGVEGGNDKVLKTLKKGEKIKDIKKSIKDAYQLGYDIDLFFLVGSPYETEDDINDSIRIAEQYPMVKASFYNLIPFPGTELYDWVKKNGMFLIEPEVYLNDIQLWSDTPVFETDDMPKAKRIEMLKRTAKVSLRKEKEFFKGKMKDSLLNNILVEIYYTPLFNKVMRVIIMNNTLRKLKDKILRGLK